MGYPTRRRWGGKKAGVDVVFARYECKRVVNPSMRSATTWREEVREPRIVVFVCPKKSVRAYRAALFVFVLARARGRIPYCDHDHRDFSCSFLLWTFVVLHYDTLRRSSTHFLGHGHSFYGGDKDRFIIISAKLLTVIFVRA